MNTSGVEVLGRFKGLCNTGHSQPYIRGLGRRCGFIQPPAVDNTIRFAKEEYVIRDEHEFFSFISLLVSPKRSRYACRPLRPARILFFDIRRSTSGITWCWSSSLTSQTASSIWRSSGSGLMETYAGSMPLRRARSDRAKGHQSWGLLCGRGESLRWGRGLHTVLQLTLPKQRCGLQTGFWEITPVKSRSRQPHAKRALVISVAEASGRAWERRAPEAEPVVSRSVWLPVCRAGSGACVFARLKGDGVAWSG